MLYIIMQKRSKRKAPYKEVNKGRETGFRSALLNVFITAYTHTEHLFKKKKTSVGSGWFESSRSLKHAGKSTVISTSV